MQTYHRKQKQIRMWPMLKFCAHPTSKNYCHEEQSRWQSMIKIQIFVLLIQITMQKNIFPFAYLKNLHPVWNNWPEKGQNITSPILHTRLYLNSGEWLWKGISVKEADFCILRIESWCLCCPRLQMKVRRNVFTNMSGPHLPVAKFPNTNTKVTNTK